MLRDLKTREGLAAALDSDVATIENAVACNPYRRVTIFQRGKMRITWEPSTALKPLQWRLKALLEKEYAPPPSTHGYVPGRSIVTNARIHLSSNGLLNFDFHNFFGSVTRRKVFDMLSLNYRIRPSVAGFIVDIVTREGNLPMGAPTSPVLSNMVLSRFDKRVAALSLSFGCVYTRWSDDCSISTVEPCFPSQLARRADGQVSLGSVLRREIARIGFVLNDEKTRLSERYHQRMEVTGVVVGDRLSLARRYIRTLRSLLHEWEVRGLEGASTRFQASGYKRRDYAETVFGRIQYVRMIYGPNDPLYQQLRYRFDKLKAANG